MWVLPDFVVEGLEATVSGGVAVYNNCQPIIVLGLILNRLPAKTYIPRVWTCPVVARNVKFSSEAVSPGELSYPKPLSFPSGPRYISVKR